MGAQLVSRLLVSGWRSCHDCACVEIACVGVARARFVPWVTAAMCSACVCSKGVLCSVWVPVPGKLWLVIHAAAHLVGKHRWVAQQHGPCSISGAKSWRQLFPLELVALGLPVNKWAGSLLISSNLANVSSTHCRNTCFLMHWATWGKPSPSTPMGICLWGWWLAGAGCRCCVLNSSASTALALNLNASGPHRHSA